jgi:hypothetical protein
MGVLMTDYTKLIEALRLCGSPDAVCKGQCPYYGVENCLSKKDLDAADALEAAEKRIAELEDDLMNGTISNIDRYKIYDYTVRDLILFADMCKRNDVKESDLKQAAWNLELAARAVMNERSEMIKNEMGNIVMRFTPDFEKAYEEMMPNCGARMRGENDEQIH